MSSFLRLGLLAKPQRVSNRLAVSCPRRAPTPLLSPPTRSFSIGNALKAQGSDVPPVIELTNSMLDRSIEDVSADDSRSVFTYQDRTVQEVLEHKKRFKEPEMVFEGRSVFDAITEMTTRGVGALICCDPDGKISGIFTERDYLNKIAVRGKNSRFTKVKEVMTAPVITTPTYAKVGAILHLMTEKRFRHLPVVDNSGKVIGLISIGDLVKEITDEYRDTIKNLQQFIERTY